MTTPDRTPAPLCASLMVLLGAALAAPTPAFAQDATAQERAASDAIPAGMTPTYDRATGRLTRLEGRAFVTASRFDRATAGLALRPLVLRLTGALGARGFDWEVDFVGVAGELVSVRYVPSLDGAPLEGASARFTVSSGGALLSLDAYGMAEAPAATRYDVAPADAAELARIAPVNATETAYALRPRRVLVREGDRVVTAYRVEVRDPAVMSGQWSVLVDATTGEARDVRREAISSVTGTARGRAKTTGSPSYGAPVMTPLSSLYVSGNIPTSGLARLTTDGCAETDIQISDDGTRLVWTSDCGGDREIWTALVDGSGVAQLTSNADEDHSPRISADGSTIVFVSDRDGDDELFAMDAAGGGLVQLTSNGASDAEPSLSDDGGFIAFVSDRSGNDDVWTLDVGTLVVTQITTNTGRDHAPALAGDRSAIAFLSDREGDEEVFLQSLAGGPLEQLTFDAIEQGPPTISDDGDVIAFAARAFDAPSRGGINASSTNLSGGHFSARLRTPKWSIWVSNVAFGTLERLTENSESCVRPALSGNGFVVGYVREAGSTRGTLVLEDIASGIDFERAIVDPTVTPTLSEDAIAGGYVAPESAIAVDAYAWSALISDFDVTDSAGAYSLDLPDGETASVSARLRGRWAKVVDLAPGTPVEKVRVSVPTPAAGILLTFNPFGMFTLPEAQVTAYVEATGAHDYVADTLNSPRLGMATSDPIDEQMRVEVNGPSEIHNAFFFPGTKTTRYFRAKSADRPNTAIPSVIWHEYGHFADDRHGGLRRHNGFEHVYGTSEGFADAIALMGKGITEIGEDWKGPGTSARDYLVETNVADNGAEDRHYDCSKCRTVGGRPEPHDHGEALANFAMRLKEARPGDADELIMGALAMNPGSMQEVVDLVMALAGTPAFCPGCAGDVTRDVDLYQDICRAAASAGFQCPGRPDVGSRACMAGACPGNFAEHFSTGTEWLGATVVGNDPGCIGGDDDGVSVVGAPVGGEPIEFDITLTVASQLLSKGRYTRDETGAAIPAHALYLNAWLYVDDGMGSYTSHKVMGTGAGQPYTGDLMTGGADTLAFDPNLWPGASKTFRFFIDLPDVDAATTAILRVRLDYGEDAGRLSIPRSFGSLSGACGIARFGEVEDHRFVIVPPGP